MADRVVSPRCGGKSAGWKRSLIRPGASLGRTQPAIEAKSKLRYVRHASIHRKMNLRRRNAMRMSNTPPKPERCLGYGVQPDTLLKEALTSIGHFGGPFFSQLRKYALLHFLYLRITCLIAAVFWFQIVSMSAITIGDKVETTATINVRQTAAGAKLGMQSLGTIGTVIGGPTVAILNGIPYTWWDVSFSSPPNGWIADTNIKAARPTQLPTNSASPATGRPDPAQNSTHTVESAYTEALGHISQASIGTTIDKDELMQGVLLLSSLSSNFPSLTKAMMVSADIKTFVDTDYDNAINLYKQILSKDPDVVAAYVGEGSAIFRQAADALFKMQNKLVGELMLTQHAREAVDLFDAAIKLQPRNFAANYNKACVLKFIGRNDEAIKSFKNAADARVQVKYDGAIPMINDEETTTSLMQSDTMCYIGGAAKYIVEKSGMSVLNEGGTSVMFVHLGADHGFYLSNKNDATAFCYLNIAKCYAGYDCSNDNKNLGKALENINTAISFNPQIPELIRVKAQLHLDTEQTEEYEHDKKTYEALMEKMKPPGP